MLTRPRIALVLGGGAARGLAHIGALEVLEEEGIEPEFLVGSSMGGLIAALAATGRGAAEIRALARGFFILLPVSSLAVSSNGSGSFGPRCRCSSKRASSR